MCDCMKFFVAVFDISESRQRQTVSILDSPSRSVTVSISRSVIVSNSCAGEHDSGSREHARNRFRAAEFGKTKRGVYSVCVFITAVPTLIPVSYTHLTLPTKA